MLTSLFYLICMYGNFTDWVNSTYYRCRKLNAKFEFKNSYDTIIILWESVYLFLNIIVNKETVIS